MRHRRESSERKAACRRGTLLLLIALGACDPIRSISLAREIPHPLDSACLVAALGRSELVARAGVTDGSSIVFADLVVPKNVDRPDPAPQLLVRESSTDDGRTVIIFDVAWIGRAGGQEYRRHLESSVKTLQELAIRECDLHSTVPPSR